MGAIRLPSRRDSYPETEDAVRAAVASVRFDVPVTDDLVSDFGFITGSRRTGDRVLLRLDRAIPVWRGEDNWWTETLNAQTYEYEVDERFGSVAPRLCALPPDDPRTCDLATLLRRIDEGDRRSGGGPPVASIPVWFGLDEAREVAVT